MDERKRRIGMNEVLYRHVNEQIRSLDDRLPNERIEEHSFVCECGNGECAERIDLVAGEYERIHADPAQFVVVPGHIVPDVEYVVEEHGRYTVIRKREGGPAELAESMRALDP